MRIRDHRVDCFPTLLAGLSLLFGYMEKTRVEALDPCMVATFSLFPCLAQIEHDAKEIDLSRRGISVLPDGAFAKFTNLAVLDLSFNRIRSLSQDVFDGLTELRTLRLNNNLIETLSGSTSSWLLFLQNVKPEVFLANNRFVCNCSVTWMTELLMADEIIQDGPALRCSEPPDWHDLFMKNMPSTIDAACKGVATGTSLGTRYCGNSDMFPCTTTTNEGIPVGMPLCISRDLLCDGTESCFNGNDESPFICAGYRRPPKASELLPPPKDAVGYYDSVISRYVPTKIPFTNIQQEVTNAEAVTTNCRKSMFKCFAGSLCISSERVCDGNADCPDGADEEVSRCSKLVPVQEFVHKPTTAKHTTKSQNESMTFEVSQKLKGNLTAKSSPVNERSPELQKNHASSLTSLYTELTSRTPTAESVTGIFVEEVPAPKLGDPLFGFFLQKEIFLSGPTSEYATHPTITFPQVNGLAHVNNFDLNLPADGSAVMVPTTNMATKAEPTVAQTTVHAKEVQTMPAESGIDLLQPRNVHIVSNANQDLTIAWSAPVSIQGGNWQLVAYSIVCDVNRNGSGKRKKSPLLSTLVHEHIFHHILPDDSLKIIVKALYADMDHQRYEIASEPLLRAESKLLSAEKKDVALPSAKQVNYPGKMGFEDVLGIAVGGTLAGLMALLLGFYFFKRKNSFLHNGGSATHGRALRMRKVERTHQKMHEKSLSSEPIYSEPEYSQRGLELAECANLYSRGIIHGGLRPPSSYHGHVPVIPEDSYVQVLESESSFYGPVHSRPCSEYSCYSISAGINQTAPTGNARMIPPSIPPPSECGSFAVYDSDNCSVGYYYHNSGLMPRCLHAQHSYKHYGDTLTPCRGVPPDHGLTLSGCSLQHQMPPLSATSPLQTSNQ